MDPFDATLIGPETPTRSEKENDMQFQINTAGGSKLGSRALPGNVLGILRNTTLLAYFTEFLTSKKADENIHFILAVERNMDPDTNGPIN